MTISAYPATVQKLLDTWNAAFPVTNVATDVYVSDGPGASETELQRRILVGVSSDDPLVAPGTAGQGTVKWATMGSNHTRDEMFSVVCVVISETGDQDPAGRRTDAFNLMGGAVTAITTDPSLGRPGGVLYLDSYEWTYLPESNQYGTAGAIQLTLNWRARI